MKKTKQKPVSLVIKKKRKIFSLLTRLRYINFLSTSAKYLCIGNVCFVLKIIFSYSQVNMQKPFWAKYARDWKDAQRQFRFRKKSVFFLFKNISKKPFSPKSIFVQPSKLFRSIFSFGKKQFLIGTLKTNIFWVYHCLRMLES